MLGTKLSFQLLVFSESASLFHIRARSTHGKSVICLNKITLTIIY